MTLRQLFLTGYSALNHTQFACWYLGGYRSRWPRAYQGAKDAGLVDRHQGEGSSCPRVLIMAPGAVTYAEVAPPAVNKTDQIAADRLFDDAMENNDGLFDGPVVLCNKIAGWNTDDMIVYWSRASYRVFALRRFDYDISSIFVTVLLPAARGGFVVARASSSTVQAGLWQLPGGSVMPPFPGRPLDMEYLAEEAARELLEETGLFRPARALRPWVFSRADHGNLGVCFISSEVGRHDIDTMNHHLSTTSDGELTDIELVRSTTDLQLLGYQVDYLGDYAQHFFMSG
jgi:ADP-ribose pyrophosphatase YjhB (NUDIX family)